MPVPGPARIGRWRVHEEKSGDARGGGRRGHVSHSSLRVGDGPAGSGLSAWVSESVCARALLRDGGLLKYQQRSTVVNECSQLTRRAASVTIWIR